MAYFQFTPEEDGKYCFCSINADNETYGGIPDAETGMGYGNSGSNDFSVECDLIAGHTYELWANYDSDRTGSFDVKVFKNDNDIRIELY